jgi:hypothetical protein
MIENFNNIIVYGTDWTVETLNNQLSSPLSYKCDVDDWSLTKKSRFIESLLLGLPVPQIVLVNQGGKGYLILDGCKRIRAIQQFYGHDSKYNHFKLEDLEFISKLNGLGYEDFETMYQDGLDNQPIRIIIIKNLYDEEVLLNISQRLNLK